MPELFDHPMFSILAVLLALSAFALFVPVPFLLFRVGRHLREIHAVMDEMAFQIERLVTKSSPIFDSAIQALENTKKCPQCSKMVDQAYGACPFCSHKFSQKYFLSIIGPGDEAALDAAAKKLASAFKMDFHELKHRLRMGFDYAISDHARRREVMGALEKLGCTVKEVVRWV
jgi:recombinational DNA repair protein RecR